MQDSNSYRLFANRAGSANGGRFGDIAVQILSRTPGCRKEGEATDPVRRNSYHEASSKAQPWRIHRQGGGCRKQWAAIKGAVLGALDKLYRIHCIELRQARADRRAGLTESVPSPSDRLHADDRAVLRYMLDRYNHLTGQLYPCADTIAAETGKSLGFVKAALARLKRFGFINWVRRTKTKEGSEGQAGPQLEQTSNAYYFAWAEELIAAAKATFQNLLTIATRKLRGDPKPPRAVAPSDPALAAALARMGSTIDRRDAAMPSASL